MPTWYVDSSATGAQTGTSPADAWVEFEYAFSGLSNHISGTTSDNGGPVAYGDKVIIRRIHSETWDTSSVSAVRPNWTGTIDLKTAPIFAKDGSDLVGQVGAWSGDSASAVPTIDGAASPSANHRFLMNGGHCCIFYGIKFYNWQNNSGVIASGSNYCWVRCVNCEFDKNRRSIYVDWVRSSGWEAINCTWVKNGAAAETDCIYLVCAMIVRGCTFRGMSRCINLATTPIFLILEDCVFSGTAVGGIVGIGGGVSGAIRHIIARNVKGIDWNTILTDKQNISFIRIEDHDKANDRSEQLNYWSQVVGGESKRNVTTTHGTDDFSYKFEPNNLPRQAFPQKFFEAPVWIPSGTSIVKTHILVNTWTNHPGSSHVYLKVNPFNTSDSTDADRDVFQTTQGFTTNSSWVTFQTSVDAATAGPAMVEAYLATNDGGSEVVYLSPVVTIE